MSKATCYQNFELLFQYISKRNLWKALFTAFAFLNTTIETYSQCSSCQLPGWQYVKEVTINNSAGSTSYTNIQELITIDTQTPISQGKMNASGDDIRFVDSDCNTSLCYWIESGINTTTTQIWVKIPSLAANTTKTIFMFYGNTGAAASSSFSCTFPNVLTVTGTQTLTGNQNYDWVDIQAGSTVNVGAGQILSFKGRKIIMAGTINGDNAGYGPASGPGAGGNGGGSSGGGGGGYGGAGGSGKCPGGGSGAANGTANGLDIDMGSGGGASDCSPPGGGGGAVKFESARIDITGTISVNGYNVGGSCGEEAAGGGSGGGILIYSNDISGNGTLSARGGYGQNSNDKEGGGGGGGGRIKLFYCNTNTFSGTTDVTKAGPGAGDQCSADDAQNGTSTINTFACESIAIGPEAYGVLADAGQDVSYCSGSSAGIGSAAITGNTYSWSPASGLSSSILSNPTVVLGNSGATNIVTDYIVTASSNGCSSKDTVQVTVFPLPTSTFSASGPVCVTEPSLITYTGNATAGATYVWDFNGGTVLSGTGQGPYQVAWSQAGTPNITLTVIENGCTSSATQVTVSVNPPAADAGPDVSFCSGESDTLGTTTTPGFTYSWSPTTGLNNPAISNPVITLTNTTTSPITINYIVTTTFTSCIISDTVAVTVNPAPLSIAGTDTGYCSGDSVLIGTSSNPSFSYLWSPGSGLSSDTISNPWVNATHFNSAPLTTNYIVTTTYTQYNCSSKDTVVISTYQKPVAAFSLPDSSCTQELTPVIYTGNATPAANYTWTFGGGNASPGSGQGPQQVSWANAGMAYVSLSVSENGCTSTTETDSVFVKPAPVSDAGNDISFCSGSSAVLGAPSLPFHTYLWAPASTGLSSSTSSSPTLTLSNSTNTNQLYDYSVTTTLFGCSVNDTVQVTVYPLPTSDFSFSNICQNQTANFSAQSNVQNVTSWIWDFGDGTITNAAQNTSHAYSTAGSFNVELLTISGFGCADSISQTIIINPNPLIAFNANDSSGCEPFCTFFNDLSVVTGGNSIAWSWNFGDGDTSNLKNPSHCYTTASISASDFFTVALTVTSDSGCIAMGSKNNYITVYPKPEANFAIDPALTDIANPLISITDSSTGADSWTWDFGDQQTDNSPNPSSHTYADTGTYTITLITSTLNNCLDTSYQNLVIEPNFIFFIPTAFTPDNNGKNDSFSPKGVFLKEFQMLIFDRWGNLVYRTDDINEPWDGKIKNGNETAQTDVYVYSITVTDLKKKVHEYRGTLTLLK